MKKADFCTFYIVRHGESTWNAKGIIQGHRNPRLTKKGFSQVCSLSKKFRKINLSAVFSSDLYRAKKTAEVIALDHKLAVTSSRLLREKKYGRFEGKKARLMKAELKKLLEKRNRLPKEKRFEFKIANDIESDQQIVSRFITFLRQTALAFPGKKVFIVCHGALIRTFLIHLGFAEYEQLPSGSIKNTGYAVIESDGVDFFVKETSGINIIPLQSNRQNR